MQMDPRWLAGIRAWAEANSSVAEVWLFGSRAKGRARADSDIDLALLLMVPEGDHDWAMGNYCALGDRWQAELRAIVRRHVSLVHFPRSGEAVPEEMVEARGSAVRLWSRP